jgi:hypothetical protein
VPAAQIRSVAAAPAAAVAVAPRSAIEMMARAPAKKVAKKVRRQARHRLVLSAPLPKIMPACPSWAVKLTGVPPSLPFPRILLSAGREEAGEEGRQEGR